MLLSRDYAASELGPSDIFNPGAFLIEFFEWIGWAYDLRRAPKPMVEKRSAKMGDSTPRLSSSKMDILLGCITICQPFWILWLKFIYDNSVQFLI